jgi:hypothetical protein
VANQLAAAGIEPSGFFDFTPVGAVMLLAGPRSCSWPAG